MKKVIYGVLAAAMMLNAGAVMASNTDPHKGERGKYDKLEFCDNMSWTFGGKSSSMAKQCSKHIPKQGIVSQSEGKGKEWGKAFPKSWFVNPNNNYGKAKEGDVYLNYKNGKFKWQQYHEQQSTKYYDKNRGTTWVDVIRTKQIDKNDIVPYVLNATGGISPNAMTVAAKAEYAKQLPQYFINQANALDKASKDAKTNELKEKMYNECVLDMGAVGVFGAGQVICNVFK